ncbi:hypothetical protein AB1E18_010855 [Capra hircus]
MLALTPPEPPLSQARGARCGAPGAVPRELILEVPSEKRHAQTWRRSVKPAFGGQGATCPPPCVLPTRPAPRRGTRRPEPDRARGEAGNAGSVSPTSLSAGLGRFRGQQPRRPRAPRLHGPREVRRASRRLRSRGFPGSRRRAGGAAAEVAGASGRPGLPRGRRPPASPGVWSGAALPRGGCSEGRVATPLREAVCCPRGGGRPAGTRAGRALGTRRAPRGRLAVLSRASGGEKRRLGTRRDVNVPQATAMRFLPHCSAKLRADSGALEGEAGN